MLLHKACRCTADALSLGDLQAAKYDESRTWSCVLQQRSAFCAIDPAILVQGMPKEHRCGRGALDISEQLKSLVLMNMQGWHRQY